MKASTEPLAALYSEHRSIAAVLAALEALVRERRDRGAKIDPRVFRAALYYLDVFAEREHHPKEERALFARLRGRTHEADTVLDELGREHEAGERAMRERLDGDRGGIRRAPGSARRGGHRRLRCAVPADREPRSGADRPRSAGQAVAARALARPGAGNARV